LCICKQRVPRYQRLWERNSQFSWIASDFVCNLQGAKQLLAPTLLYGLARLPQLSLLNTTARAASPPHFSSTSIISYARPAHSSHLAIIHAAGINLTAILINIVLVASYLMSSTLTASTFHRHRTRRVLRSSTPPASSFYRYRIRRVASYCTTSHCPCECCANNSQSSLIFMPCHICYRPCRRWQPHCHPH